MRFQKSIDSETKRSPNTSGGQYMSILKSRIILNALHYDQLTLYSSEKSCISRRDIENYRLLNITLSGIYLHTYEGRCNIHILRANILGLDDTIRLALPNKTKNIMIPTIVTYLLLKVICTTVYWFLFTLPNGLQNFIKKIRRRSGKF